jgi:hypothetical protein
VSLSLTVFTAFCLLQQQQQHQTIMGNMGLLLPSTRCTPTIHEDSRAPTTPSTATSASSDDHLPPPDSSPSSSELSSLASLSSSALSLPPGTAQRDDDDSNAMEVKVEAEPPNLSPAAIAASAAAAAVAVSSTSSSYSASSYPLVFVDDDTIRATLLPRVGRAIYANEQQYVLEQLLPVQHRYDLQAQETTVPTTTQTQLLYPFGTVGFYNHRPVQILSPYAVEPGPLRRKWMERFVQVRVVVCTYFYFCD